MLKKAIYLLLAVLLLLSGCAQTGTPEHSEPPITDTPPTAEASLQPGEPGITDADRYPNAWAFYKNMYKNNFTLDEDGNFAWNYPTMSAHFKVTPSPEQAYPLYSGGDLTLEYDGVTDHEMIGPAFCFQLITEREKWVVNKLPKLEIYLDGQWWPVSVMYGNSNTAEGYRDYSEGSNDLFHSTLAYGSQAPLPEGRYRYVFQITKDSSDTDESFLVTEFWFSPFYCSYDQVYVCDNMKLRSGGYAENNSLWKTADYSNYWSFTCGYLIWERDGELAWDFPSLPTDIKVLPVEEYNIYSGDDLALEYNGWEHDGEDTPVFRFTLKNNTNRPITVYNAIPRLQVCLEGEWWPVHTAYETSPVDMYWDIEPGASPLSKPALHIFYNERAEKYVPLAEGHYRLVVNLAPEEDAMLVAEFDYDPKAKN